MKSAPQLNSPYGGDLVSLLVGGDERLALLEDSVALESLTLSPRALCDLELLSVGGFSPLTSFMNKKDYESVLKRMRLNNGMLFPMPVTLSVNQKYKLGQKLALRDGYSNL